MTIVIENCLPVSWVAYLQSHGHTARHWRELGPVNAPDSDIMLWANENAAVVLTQDLDFTKLLAPVCRRGVRNPRTDTHSLAQVRRNV